MSKKKALIITDGTEEIHSIAKILTGALEGFKPKICPADKFSGTDLLPVDIFILGCQKPNPPAFEYLEDLLSHINLASRKCGVFSVKQNAIKYLQDIVKDSEADLAEPLLVTDEQPKKSDAKKWLKGLLK